MHQLAPRITADPQVCFGKAVIEGTRVPVEAVVGQIAAGLSPEQVAEEYEISVEDVRAALTYAAQSVADERILPLKD